MKTFIVEAERTKTGWWALACYDPGCFSQVRRLDQVDDDMREAIAYLAGIPEDEVRIETHPIFDAEGMAALALAKEARIKEDQARAEAQQQTTKAIHALAKVGISTRDIGHLIGISHQRVAQLAAQ